MYRAVQVDTVVTGGLGAELAFCDAMELTEPMSTGPEIGRCVSVAPTHKYGYSHMQIVRDLAYHNLSVYLPN